MVNGGTEPKDSSAEPERDEACSDLPTEAQTEAARGVIRGRQAAAKADYIDAIREVGVSVIAGMTKDYTDTLARFAHLARERMYQAERDAIAFVIVFGNAPAEPT